jgi:hypothetical protein
MLQAGRTCAQSLRYLDRSTGDDECLDYAAFVFWIGDNRACRTRPASSALTLFRFANFAFIFIKNIGLGTPSEIGNKFSWYKDILSQEIGSKK